MTKGEKAACPECLDLCAVSNKGTLRRHPKGAEEPCPGSGFAVRAPNTPSGGKVPLTTPREPDAPVEPAEVRPGIYRSDEPMLDPRTPVPPGHAVITLTAFVPYDGSNGRTPHEEAALLFEDPSHLYRVLDETPNERVQVLLLVGEPPKARRRRAAPDDAKAVYSDTITSSASDPDQTLGATP